MGERCQQWDWRGLIPFPAPGPAVPPLRATPAQGSQPLGVSWCQAPCDATPWEQLWDVILYFKDGLGVDSSAIVNVQLILFHCSYFPV